MKYKVSICLLLLFPIVTFPAFSQRNFIEGYLVDQKGDTIHGLIDYRNWGKNPNAVNFKKAGSEESTRFKAGQIRSFYAYNETYVSAAVEAETSSIDLSTGVSNTSNRISDDAVLRTRIDTTFLRKAFSGPKTFYSYTDAEGKPHFYIEHDGKFELLGHKVYFRVESGTRTLNHNNRYIGQLALYLNCASIQSTLKKIVYKEKSLASLFEDYYQSCGDSKASIPKTRGKTQVN